MKRYFAFLCFLALSFPAVGGPVVPVSENLKQQVEAALQAAKAQQHTPTSAVAAARSHAAVQPPSVRAEIDKKFTTLWHQTALKMNKLATKPEEWFEIRTTDTGTTQQLQRTCEQLLTMADSTLNEELHVWQFQCQELSMNYNFFFAEPFWNQLERESRHLSVFPNLSIVAQQNAKLFTTYGEQIDYAQELKGKKYILVAEASSHQDKGTIQEVIRLLEQVRAANPDTPILLALEALVTNQSTTSLRFWDEPFPSPMHYAGEKSDHLIMASGYEPILDKADELQIDTLSLDDSMFGWNGLMWTVKIAERVFPFNPFWDRNLQAIITQYSSTDMYKGVGIHPYILLDYLARTPWGIYQRNRQWSKHIGIAAPHYPIVITLVGIGHVSEGLDLLRKGSDLALIEITNTAVDIQKLQEHLEVALIQTTLSPEQKESLETMENGTISTDIFVKAETKLYGKPVTWYSVILPKQEPQSAREEKQAFLGLIPYIKIAPDEWEQNMKALEKIQELISQ